MKYELGGFEHVTWREEDRFDDPLLIEEHKDEYTKEEYALQTHQEEFIK